MGLRRALVLTTADRYFSMIVNFATLAIAARLLTPADFGVSVIGAAVITIAMAAREIAPPAYLIQKRTLGRDDIRSVFTLGMCVSAAISAGVAVAAPWLEAVYGVAGLAGYLYVIALVVLIEPFWQTINALLRRDMAFGRVAVINLTHVVTEGGVLLGLAYFGFGFLSFALGWLAASITTTLIALALRPDVSIFRPRFRGAADVAKFGGYIAGAMIFEKLYEAVPFLVFGRMMAFNQVGLLNRVFSLVRLPDKFFLGGVMSVAMPALSQISRDRGDLRAAYLRAMEHITALQWPALAMTAVLAHPLVDIVLGEQWTAAAPLIQIAALGWMFSFSNMLNYPVLVVTGAMRANLVRAAIIWPVSAAVLIAAGFLGPTAIAAALLIVMPFQAIVSIGVVKRKLGLTYLDVLGALRRSAAATAAAVALPIAYVALRGWDWGLSLPEAVLVGALSAPGWLAALRAVRHPMWAEIEGALSRVRASAILRRIYAGR